MWYSRSLTISCSKVGDTGRSYQHSKAGCMCSKDACVPILEPAFLTGFSEERKTAVLCCRQKEPKLQHSVKFLQQFISLKFRRLSSKSCGFGFSHSHASTFVWYFLIREYFISTFRIYFSLLIPRAAVFLFHLFEIC